MYSLLSTNSVWIEIFIMGFSCNIDLVIHQHRNYLVMKEVYGTDKATSKICSDQNLCFFKFQTFAKK